MRYEVLEIDIDSDTFGGKFDPSVITKITGYKTIKSVSTIIEGKEIIARKMNDDYCSDIMASAMCGGDSDVMSDLHKHSKEYYLHDKETDILYFLGYVIDENLIPNPEEIVEDDKDIFDDFVYNDKAYTLCEHMKLSDIKEHIGRWVM